jgi:uncharacterized protein YggE
MKFFFLLFLTCAVSQVNAQQFASPLSSIRVTGNAVIAAKPERALIDVGVVTQEKQAQAAFSQNTKQLDAVTAALRKLLGADADIKTTNYALNPDYQYHPIGGKPSISSYTAINVVRVTLDDLDKVGPVIDAATQAGANHVESVQFTVKDTRALHAQALREAASRARANAEALVAALNLKIVRVVSVEESRDVAAPAGEPAPGDSIDPDLRPPGGGPDPGPPNQAGLIEAQANVTLTVEVGQR